MDLQFIQRIVCSLVAIFFALAAMDAYATDAFLKPLLAEKCVRCHGGDEINGKVDLQQFGDTQQLLARPEIVKEMIQVIDANDMPPEDEPGLDEKQRSQLLDVLKNLLRESSAAQKERRPQIRRLNRFQYNNAVRDLFQLRRDVFSLPEKLMTRHDDYLLRGEDTMPKQVRVASHALQPQIGMRNVRAFPKDLRAAHGYDNQANQLTLSPLLLDAFLKLSVSIVESPDFNEQNVGIWNAFFKQPPEEADVEAETRMRLEPFLRLAFRRPIQPEILDRYAAYVKGKLEHGLSFTDSMKKVASAALCSPYFLYRSHSNDPAHRQIELASRLAFFLWSSGPDLKLLELAESGRLADPDELEQTLQRMLADPKIERFLDAFPSQWMQLDNVFAAKPDPNKQRLFSLDKDRPASVQMVLEPLLLFDAVFLENRPVAELISPKFAYQSDFLQTWYSSDLKPPTVDVEKVLADNRMRDERRRKLQTTIAAAKDEFKALIDPIKMRLLEKRKAEQGDKQPVDLKPYAAWEFDGDLKSSVNSFDLTAHGPIEFKDGMVVLKQAFLQSGNFPIDLQAKSLEVWCAVQDIKQRGGGVMGIQGPGDFFDTIVLGERKPQHWISGSNGFSRTEDFPDSTPEMEANQRLHLTMVYQQDGTTRLYRNGVPYGKSFQKGQATFPKNQTSVIFGLRHLPPGGNKYLSVSIDKARLYNRALTAEEVAAAASGAHLFVTDQELTDALEPEQRVKRETLQKTIADSEATLKAIPPNQDPNKLQQDAQRAFDDRIRGMLRSQAFQRVAASDPRYGGVITNAAVLSMTSGPKRTHPIARGAWIIEVIFNDPPPPPPNDVPPLNEEDGDQNLTIREKFAKHRENPDCAGCHSRLDPLGFALENFDITGRWRTEYENGRNVDPSGKLMRKYDFDGVVRFKESLMQEQRRFAKAFSGHLLRYALSRELQPADSLTLDAIAEKTQDGNYRLKSLIREIVFSNSFRGLQ